MLQTLLRFITRLITPLIAHKTIRANIRTKWWVRHRASSEEGRQLALKLWQHEQRPKLKHKHNTV